ncbi:MAG: undecaprenyl-diphosphate phosphatase [Pseudomonadota bacterium]|nr:undecaprenyl-diphosphate phosphatase [Pseudomonadota bacterium]
MDWIQIIVLSIVQGLTEFLPISSSAHLVLPSLLSDWPDQGLAFDVGVHFGTLLAVILFFRQTLTHMAIEVCRYPVNRAYTENVELTMKLAAATIPVVIIGLIFKSVIEAHLRTLPVIATTTIVFGLLLLWSDRRSGENNQIGWRSALLIGCAQVFALIPGTSRSGVTITAALFLGLSRQSAARFSFLLAIPTIAGAQLLLTLDLLKLGVSDWEALAAGALVSGLTAYLCIHYFIELVDRTGMTPYVIYRLILGAGLLALIWFGY